MKRGTLFIFALVVAIGFLCACQATPEKEEYYSQSTALADSDSSVSESNQIKFNVEDAGKGIEIVFDALAEPVSAEKVNVYNIKPKYFDDEDVTQVLEAMFGRGNYNIDDGLEGLRYRKQLYESGKKDDPMCPDDEYYAEILRTIEAGGEGNQEERLEKTKAEDPGLYAQLIENLENPELPGELLINEKWVSDDSSNGFPWLVTTNNTYPQAWIEYETERSAVGSSAGPVSAQDAQEQTEDLLRQIGASEWQVSSMVFPIDEFGFITDDHDCSAYRVICTRQIGTDEVLYHYLDTKGEVSTMENVSSEEDSSIDRPYAPGWAYPSLYVDVDAEGIRKLFWGSDFMVTDTVEKNVKDLPTLQDAVNKAVDEIKIRVYQYNPFAEENEGDSKNISTQIDVDNIIFGLTRVQMKDQVGEFQLVPSWDFIGSVKAWNPETNQFETIPSISNGADRSLLTLNALDLSVIDRSRID